ncbi:hypothetical protein F0224_07775 [Vibrio coralliilyticus]|uniref:hypothetical protein n=1 Tax=Vibrio coralliilyticus TaxID=190893 RepID=UPI000BAC28FC|nr:hypothetical protein [Vibrio coralliilyticus]NOI75573.1 hypothetical protein [Vibrio coralliilyticus]PAW04392.1 hypothetical protein CKJ79_06590 [Vibrio coralliilyticus]
MSVTRQSKRQQEKVRTLALDIMHRAMEISQTTQHDVHCLYHGHTNEISISFNPDGFNTTETVYIKGKYGANCVYLNDPINDVLDFFERANSKLDKLLEADTKAA